jgi:hypothetical protein
MFLKNDREVLLRITKEYLNFLTRHDLSILRGAKTVKKKLQADWHAGGNTFSQHFLPTRSAC